MSMHHCCPVTAASVSEPVSGELLVFQQVFVVLFQVTIEDRKIYASRYSARSNQWIVAVKLNKAEQKKLRGAHGHTESMDVDSDDENMDPSQCSETVHQIL